MTTHDGKSRGAEANFVLSGQRTPKESNKKPQKEAQTAWVNNFLHLWEGQIQVCHLWHRMPLVSSCFVFVPQSKSFVSSTLEYDNNKEMWKQSNSPVVLPGAALDPQVITTKQLLCAAWIRAIESISLWSYSYWGFMHLHNLMRSFITEH